MGSIVLWVFGLWNPAPTLAKKAINGIPRALFSSLAERGFQDHIFASRLPIGPRSPEVLPLPGFRYSRKRQLLPVRHGLPELKKEGEVLFVSPARRSARQEL